MDVKTMNMNMSKQELYNLCAKQLNNFLIFDESKEKKLLIEGIDVALERIRKSFALIKNKYYSRDGYVYFNTFHSGQYSIFLYYLSNSLYHIGSNPSLAERVYYLNKIFNSVDLFYEIELPDIFLLEHPVGTVMGRAKYADFFCFSQNCTVGNNKGIYPIFEEKVTMLSGAKIIGNSTIGENSIISANAYIKDTNIPRNSIVFGSSPNLVIKERTKIEMDLYFSGMWNLR